MAYQLRNIHAIKLLADNLRLYRHGRHLSQQTLANMAEMECSQVSRIERSLLNTSVSVIFALAAALNIKPSQLLEPVSGTIDYLS
jgi:transcriptional regulator with XRE-family HTH domain